MKKFIFNDSKIIIASHNKGKVKEIEAMLTLCGAVDPNKMV